MTRNAIENEFWTSKIAAGSYFENNDNLFLFEIARNANRIILAIQNGYNGNGEDA
jgi:hypothetical protein